MKRHASWFIATALATVLTVAVVGPAGAAPSSKLPASKLAALRYLRAHGYFPLRGIDNLAKAKAHAAAVVAARSGKLAPGTAAGPKAPIIGATWQGVSNASATPPDPNGAIGPSSYVEIINVNIAIYNRAGGLISTAALSTLTGDFGFLTDPTILWDPASQRFFYNVWDANSGEMDWGFSKDSNPTSISGSWCSYITNFGYTSAELPDYPKLGQTRDFLMIGVNHYTSPNFGHVDRTDLLWINKYKNPSPVTTCPAANTFGHGIFKDLRNEDNSIAFTPVPAISTDTSKNGFIITSSPDTECPDICGTGMLVTVFTLRPDRSNPSVPVLKTRGQSITVGSFEAPPDAPQKNSIRPLDTLDARMTHAVAGRDPTHGNNMAVWVAHSVLGGAGARIDWYEINPLPGNNPTLFQSGTVSNANLYVFNPGISNDRACDLAGCAHGENMVLGFTTVSSTAFPAVQMVSKVGAGAQSGLVLVKQSMTADVDFSCSQLGYCRWGDYGGATPDPTKKGGAVGEVWLSNQWTDGSAETWNWEATP